VDFNTRLKALSRLAKSTTDAAEQALRKEFAAAAAQLADTADYDQLEQGLALIDTIGFRFSDSAVQVLVGFVESIDQRQLTYSDQRRPFGNAFLNYRNSSSLIVRAIQALVRIRYLEAHAVLHALIHLSVHSAESVRKEALEGLKQLSRYDINVFYGDAQRGGIGASPQKQIVEELQKLSDPDVTTYFSAILLLLEGVLSPTMESAAWSYKALTLSHAATPAIPSVSDVRLQSIDELIRIYNLVTAVDRKLAVISALTAVTRTESRVARRDEAKAMFVRDTQKVLAFFAQVVEKDELQVVQKVEHNTYWIFVHAISDDVRDAALRVRDKISERTEYEFYRVLIGFQGIFGDWQQLKESGHEWKEIDDFRRKTARDYAENISEDNYAQWRARILNYTQTQSDDLATFPVFYQFLESFAVAQPTLAFKLLSEDTEAIRRFLIAFLRGLWSGSHKEPLRALIDSWISEGRNLYPSIKQFLSNADLDLALVKRLLSRADEMDDLPTIREAVSVAVSNYNKNGHVLIDELMLPAIELLTKRSNSDWIFDNWFRREMKEVLASVGPRAIEVILRNLTHLRELDYHSEELLYIIAQRAPDKVLEYLCARLDSDFRRADQISGIFNAIPFEFHKLNEPLSKVPELAVRMLRERYAGDYSHFMYGGARLLSNIFPNFSDKFEAELLKLVQQGGDRNYEFVLAILRNYHGQPFIHHLIKEIVKAVSPDSPFLTDAAIALESTGVVSGEFGLAEAYEQKRQEVLDWVEDPNTPVQEFAKRYIEDLEKMRNAERKRAEEDIALRKFHYGEE
jgi:hypothetical protein